MNQDLNLNVKNKNQDRNLNQDLKHIGGWLPSFSPSDEMLKLVHFI